MTRIRRWVVGLAVGILAAAVALTIQLVSAAGRSAHSGRLVATRGVLETPGTEIHRDLLAVSGARAERLGAHASAPLVGAGAPVAAISSDGASLAYNSFRWHREIDWVMSLAEQGIHTGEALGRPQIRVRHLGRGSEMPLEPGSQSLAWRSDGALAYALGSPPDYRANLPFTANVVVRSSLAATPVAWTSRPARYSVLAWAGTTLLVEREEPGATPDVLALDGPGRLRSLADRSTFLAVSPDGSRALVAETPAETPTPRLRLLRVADGAAVASLYLADARDPVTGEPTSWVTGPGSWANDRVAIASSTGLVVLRAREGLAVEQVLHLDSATRPNGQLFEPRFRGEDAREIVAWAGVPGTSPVRAAQMVCDRFELTCTRGPALAPADVPRPVYDLSGGDR